jgi:hypothetical protein
VNNQDKNILNGNPAHTANLTSSANFPLQNAPADEDDDGADGAGVGMIYVGTGVEAEGKARCAKAHLSGMLWW